MALPEFDFLVVCRILVDQPILISLGSDGFLRPVLVFPPAGQGTVEGAALTLAFPSGVFGGKLV